MIQGNFKRLFYICTHVGLGVIITIGVYLSICFFYQWSQGWLARQNYGDRSQFPLLDPLFITGVSIALCAFVCEFVVRRSDAVLNRHRWLPLFGAALLGTCFFSTEHMFAHSSRFATYWCLIPFFIYFFIIARLQRRFIAEGTFYDLLLGQVFLWPSAIIIVALNYEDMVPPGAKADDIADLFMVFITPLFFIYPGLFPRERMKKPVLLTLALFLLVFVLCGDRCFMRWLIDSEFIDYPFSDYFRRGIRTYIALFLFFIPMIFGRLLNWGILFIRFVIGRFGRKSATAG